MSNIKFKIAAKTDVGRVRTNNEDNLQAACDLTTAPMKWVNDQECDLGDKGALLVVADGMGGMNAGEVASDIAIKTIKDFFSPENITEKVTSSKVEINTFLKKSIKEADKRIKAAAKENSANRGMGTTIVIAWVLYDKLYVAWCGDSRAYIYNRKNGLRQLTKDHSYVQTLVDNGTISHEDAFDYPDSNIITRCLSDSDQKARPDALTSPVTLCDGDIVLLCTDGLSGMIRDHEMEMILTENEINMSECADKLIEAACEASGQDNITVALCKIISGGAKASRTIHKNKLSSTISFSNNTFEYKEYGRKVMKCLACLLFLCSVFAAGYYSGYNRMFCEDGTEAADTLGNDTTEIDPGVDSTGGGEGTDSVSDSTTLNDEEECEKKTASRSKDANVIGQLLATIPADTAYTVKEGDGSLSQIAQNIKRPLDKFNVTRNGQSLVQNGELKEEAGNIKAGDKLEFTNRTN